MIETTAGEAKPRQSLLLLVIIFTVLNNKNNFYR